MARRIITAGSTSANHHVHIVLSDAGGNASVSAGYANEKTFAIPVTVRDTRLTVLGTFGSGSTSTAVAIDIGPNGSAYINLFSISAPFTTTVPIQVGHVLRFRHTFSSAAVGTTGCSVDAWIG